MREVEKEVKTLVRTTWLPVVEVRRTETGSVSCTDLSKTYA